MALTKNQKMELDNAVVEVINSFLNKRFLLLEVQEQLLAKDIDTALMATISVYHSLARVSATNHYTFRKMYNSDYYMIASYEITNPIIVKDKNLIKVVDESDENHTALVTYNFDTHQASTVDESIYNILPYVFRKIFSSPYYISNLPEWIFNYTTNPTTVLDILTYCSPEMYKECPKGFINYLKETETEFTSDSLKEYYLKNILTFTGYNLFTTLREFYDVQESFNKAKFFIETNLYKSLISKMMIIDIKNGDPLPHRSNLKYFIDGLYGLYPLDKNIVEIFDTNRGLDWNCGLLEQYRSANNNKFLSAQLQKLNFINGLEYKNLVVKVPQTQADKQKEGKMQNNCVGYYYDDSIMEGRNFIYFIRLKENPNHSYITCRYNKQDARTTEFRTVNNRSVTDEDAIDFIKQIDTIINKHQNTL